MAWDMLNQGVRELPSAKVGRCDSPEEFAIIFIASGGGRRYIPLSIS
jgi:hypothetical protein